MRTARLALAWCCGVAVLAVGAALPTWTTPIDELRFIFYSLNLSILLIFASLAIAVGKLVYRLTKPL
jgi:hypothetical protein